MSTIRNYEHQHVLIYARLLYVLHRNCKRIQLFGNDKLLIKWRRSSPNEVFTKFEEMNDEILLSSNLEEHIFLVLF